MMEKKEKKPKKQSIIMTKVGDVEGVATYAPLDKLAETVLGGRNSFEADVNVSGRSLNANALWAVWYAQIAKELGDTPDAVKRECKLLYGVPLLLQGDKEFRAIWGALCKGLNYEQQLYTMRLLPVTSRFTKYMGVDYQETLEREYAKNHGIILKVL